MKRRINLIISDALYEENVTTPNKKITYELSCETPTQLLNFLEKTVIFDYEHRINEVNK